jgi:bifunctional DNA-binding transcriptional regulator/antitoxin component of YhaV-PrlF toxin-antitoxin module
MTETVFLDELGRIQIPQHLRDAMQLLPKQPLELQFTNNTLTLRPTTSGEILEQDGMFVWTGAVPEGDLLEQIRSERSDAILEKL